MNKTTRRGFFPWREMDVQEGDSKQWFLQQEIWWSSSYSAGHQVRTHARTFKANVTLSINFEYMSDWCLAFLPAVVLVLILLSNLIFWTKIEQHNLFGLYVIQVSFRRTWADLIWEKKNVFWCLSSTVFVYFRQPLCPCMASWTVWFTPGEGPTSQMPFLGRIRPWWHTIAWPSLTSHWGARLDCWL